MHDVAIYNKVLLLSYVIDDIKHLETEMAGTIDPSLMVEYREEMRGLVEELNVVSVRCIELLEVYLKDCREQDEPISLDYYRIYKELSKAKK